MEGLAERTNELLLQSKQEIEALLQADGWRRIGVSNEVESWSHSTESGINMIKAIGTIQTEPEAIRALLMDHTRKHEWDKMIRSSEVVASFSEDRFIFHQLFKLKFPISNRDFVFAAGVFREDGKIIIIGRSIDAGVPEISGAVRAELLTSCYILEPIDGGTRITFMANADPKGLLPHFIVNYVAKSQGQNIHRIRQVLTKH